MTSSATRSARGSIAESGAARWASRAAVVVALGFVAVATIAVVRANDDRATLVQRGQTDSVVASLEDRMIAYEEILYGLRGGFGLQPELSYREFNDLVNLALVDDRLPGVQVLGAAHLVRADELAAYEGETAALSAASELSYPDFEVYPEPAAAELLPIDYIEPQVGNERAFGLDFYSEPNRRTAAQRARDSGRSAATAPVTLVQETGTQSAFLLMLPLYGTDEPTGTVEERRAAFDGVVYAAFRMDDVVSETLGDSSTQHLAIIDAESGISLVGDAGAADDVAGDSPRFGQLEIGGRSWQIIVTDPGSPLSTIQRWLPLAVALFGLAMVVLTAQLVRTVRSVRRRAQSLAETMTSELVEAERRSSETSNTLLGVLGAATESAIIATDDEGVVTVFNAGAERMLGHEAEQVVGQFDLTAFHDAAEIAASMSDGGYSSEFDALVGSARRGVPHTGLWTHVRSDGRTYPVELTVTARYDGDDRLRGFIAVGIDVTERELAHAKQEALLAQEREMVAKLTEVDRVKSDFVSTTSHELRTPLTSIIGYTELLQDEFFENIGHRRMLDTVADNAQRLLLLVEDLLTLSRVESGAVNATHEPCDLAKLVASVEKATAPMAADHRVTVDCDVSGAVPVIGSPGELERVVLNLVTNAIKFSNRGGQVTISAGLSPDGEHAVLRVADEGIGISEADQPQMFTRFFRSKQAEERVIPGTGLGLSIVADIVERHGGTVGIESTEHVGTTMTVELPVAGVASTSSADEDLELTT